ncbi:phosphorylase b kinase gamma catalytic chain, skeletal muscle/heart isoform isoform X1 [Drosophila subobscura]|uniref:phosphorylase b kinase gamma catalytic chain, skeletal muscle/heart isoform isoform X1 n=1 Tax=Drosophila subobscura TaxID=7241 RepID=UPI00155B16F6|nr:phosphorylase b kinase gamma catalytic chain, skeletal muscle/heart isoform isoform X1 [Drosophila subobscura]XP_034672220.1 phosphorylase b kinase gamma catalytic chain, skeletal muscle/heart isoform isoform X1 [Drosophila subobscura]XP_034672221.1 phosphorylase b kinase gamma catalytic chain, skeletal muscle/heart isoform isoform X1 [Drosophila subobscura]XP_034672222.1 phosphorylase b kinase gamma catalytic chain, skeletal muscle/heart isoform isoform X1 [Drosophila subobscura]XP_03467222
MAKDEEDDLLPDKDAAKGFYAKYEPKEILGRGISSTVRRCIEKETGKEFAAKIIDLGATTEAGETNPYHMLEATRQEISILRQVMGHPYIIDLQDVFESDAFVFLVFELCPKGELFDYLTSVVTLSEKKTRTIMRQIFEGVEYIHAKSIVHRDLKPENILLDENHNVKITDFGFARQLQEGEKLTDLCGTPGYLAPETLKCNMFEGSPGYSQEVDIWACGVIMFTLLVGCPPFWHRKQMVMLRNIMEGKYSFTSPEWADISEDPKDLIRKCLVVDPAQRITVTEVLRHPFFNQMLFEQNIDGLKRSLSTKSRRMSRITEIALVLMGDLTTARPSPTSAYAPGRYQNSAASAASASVSGSSASAAPAAFRYDRINSNGGGGGGPNPCGSSYLYYSAPQSSYSSNRLRDVLPPPDLDDPSSPCTSANCYKTLTATVYYQQQPQQQQQQQQQQHQQQHYQQQHQQTARANAGNNYESVAQQQHLLHAQVQLRKQSRFNARKKFQFAILVIRAVIRIRRLRFTAEPLHVEEAIRDPYRVKVLRKVIDGCAFRVYGHWVKKGEGQNRAALFENTPRTELHALYINNLSR